MADIPFSKIDPFASTSPTTGVGSIGGQLAGASKVPSFEKYMSGADNLMSNPAFAEAATQANLNSDPYEQPEMQERGFFARPRSTSNDRTDRGPNAYIRLLTSKEQASNYKGGDITARQVGSTDPKSTLADSIKTMSQDDEASGYDSFLLTSVHASLDEKVQIIEVFGDNEVAYYFGRQPMVFTFTGVLLDSPDNSWFTDWLYAFTGAMRGTELARNFELLRIVLPNMTVDGSMMSCTWDQRSENDVGIAFTFQFLAKSLIPTPAIPIGTPINNAAELINFNNIDSFRTQLDINNLRQQGAELLGFVQNPATSLSQMGSALSSFGSGVAGSLGMIGSSSAVSRFIDGLSAGVSDIKNSIFGNGSLFGSLASSLNGIRVSLFAPIYGVMNSLTKLVKNIFGVGSIGGIFNSLVAPIRNILRDITNIANQATAIVNMVTGGIVGLGRGLGTGFGLIPDFNSAVKAVSRTMGTIAAAPLTVSSSVKSLVNGGYIPASAGFLAANPKHSLSRSASLGGSSGSGGPGASLGLSRAGLSTQMAILSSQKTSLSTAGASL